MSLKEKELQLKKMMEDELEAKSGHHTPEGLFTKPTQDIVDGLLKDAHGDEELALRRITFYINRAGDGLSNKTAVNAAKRELEKKVEAKNEAKKSALNKGLREYYKNVYNTMFEYYPSQANSKMQEEDAIKYLLDNDINSAWMFASPHPEVVLGNRAIGLFGVYKNGMLKMLTHNVGDEGKGKAHWVDEGITITPEEFKELIENDENNSSTAPWSKWVEDHYYPVEVQKDMLETGKKLYKAWLDRFYEENKDELDLKSPYDMKTQTKFKSFWEHLPDRDRMRYANGVSDPYGLSTIDIEHGMPIIRMRMKKSPQRNNSRSVSVSPDEEMLLKYPEYKKELEQWKKDKEDPDIKIEPNISSYTPLVVGEPSVMKRVGKDAKGQDIWVKVTDKEEKDALLAKHNRPMPKLIIPEPDNSEPDTSKMSGEDKVAYYLKKFGDQYEKFAHQTIKDPTGEEWKIVDVLEPKRANDIPQFELKSVKSPSFPPIQITAGSDKPGRGGLLDWLDAFNDALYDDDSEENDDSTDQEVDKDMAKSLEMLKKKYEG